MRMKNKKTVDNRILEGAMEEIRSAFCFIGFKLNPLILREERRKTK